jgi:hypothetical protein
MSTIAIVKEVLTKQATAKKIRVNMTSEIRDETVANVLKLLHPKLSYTLGLARKVEMIEALRVGSVPCCPVLIGPVYELKLVWCLAAGNQGSERRSGVLDGGVP